MDRFYSRLLIYGLVILACACTSSEKIPSTTNKEPSNPPGVGNSSDPMIPIEGNTNSGETNNTIPNDDAPTEPTDNINPTSGQSFYIDAKAGADNNPGTQNLPWKTLSSLQRVTLQPGDTIHMRRGQIWREPLEIVQSGSVQNPIKVTAYGNGDNPVVSAGVVIEKQAAWQGPLENNIYSLGFGDSTTHYTNFPVAVISSTGAIADYQLIPRANNATELGSLDTGYYVENIAGIRTVYFKPPMSNPNPGDYQMELSARGRAISISGDYIQLEHISAMLSNNGSAQYDPPVVEATIYSTGKATQLRDCQARFGRSFGIAISGEESKITDSLAEYNASTGLYILTDKAVRSEIRNSRSQFNGNLVFSDKTDRGGIGIQASDSIVQGNFVIANGNPQDNNPTRPGGDAAISIFRAANVRVEQNYIHDSVRNAIQTSYDDRTYGHEIHRNIVFNWNLLETQATTNTSAIYVSGYGQSNNAGTFSILNNTIYSDQENVYLIGISIALPSNADRVNDATLLNNLIYFPNNTHASSRGIRVTREANIVNSRIDFNNVFIPNTLNHYGWFARGNVYASASALYADTGYGLHDINIDPMLLQAMPTSIQAFSLQATSPLIDMGSKNNSNMDFAGNSIINMPDIGALEFIDSDGDTIADFSDNCQAIPNLDQADSNQDGVGDACSKSI